MLVFCVLGGNIFDASKKAAVVCGLTEPHLVSSLRGSPGADEASGGTEVLCSPSGDSPTPLPNFLKPFGKTLLGASENSAAG